MLRIAPQDPGTPDAVSLIDQLSHTLESVTGGNGKSSFNPDDVRGSKAMFVVARDSCGVAVGCGAFRQLEDGVAEVKRMYAIPGSRGVGTAILQYLEAQALQMGYTEFRLETRLVNSQAVRFYERRGFKRIPNFGKYVGRPEAVCLAKRLSGSTEASLRV